MISEQQTERICRNCGDMLPIDNGVQSGFYCCDEYYCSENCVAKGNGLRNHYEWEQVHYSDGGECYYTEWEAEE